ncbi:hypothetical protein ABAC460_01555 [Asticcacaulis sp. AC460]|uniref:DUF4167 domain-containing protein n=1 Tax=Asticcacaulis sp. AC460 TaxID=1282360 RepID=UPI0003C3BFF9|nr:DUF4167 domain-containing protein [Asticcacaulis sp. AC460]ESQ92962.1 hypothetical protein ABAC460_01555 [Asticcacaulis sp. AC460]
MKRQRNRNRKPSSGNQNNPNRAYESNGPEGTKVRGNAQTIYEKYQQLARDANSSGDRVLAENHLQHAEHYFRMIRQMQPQRPVSEFVQRDPFASAWDDYDDDIENENTEVEAEAVVEDQAQAEEQARYERGRERDRGNGDRPNGNGNRDRDRDRPNGERNREFRNNGDRQNGDREFRNNNERPNGDRPNTERPNNQRTEPRTFEPRDSRDEGEIGPDGRRETRRERYERRRLQRFAEQEANLNGSYAPTQPQAAAFVASTEPLGVPAGRAPSSLTEAAPTVEAPVAAQPPVREAREPRARREKPQAVDPSQLPAFLSRPTPLPAAEPPAAAEDEAPAKPKRTRKRKEDAATEEA